MAKKKVKSIYENTEPLWKYIRGEGYWVSIKEPDDYGNWNVNLYGDEVMELEEELQAYLNEAVEFAKAEGKDVQNVADVFKTDKEGRKYLKAKKTQYDEDTPPPKIYNITGDEVTDEWKDPIGGGSKLRIKVMIKPYYMNTTKTVGLSTKLMAVQVIKNKEFAGGSGFGDESGGDTPPFDTVENEDY
jgi:hypothetical protein